MKQLIDILESFDTLYHFTNGKNVVGILKRNEFILSEDDGYSPNSYKYYMSLTRMPYAKTGYPTTLISDDVVRLVMDAAMLNSKFKIKAIDTMKGKSYYNGNVEAEERLLSSKSLIKDFAKYIKRIDINTSTIGAKDADDIIQYAERLNIPVEVYDSDKLFNTAK